MAYLNGKKPKAQEPVNATKYKSSFLVDSGKRLFGKLFDDTFNKNSSTNINNIVEKLKPTISNAINTGSKFIEAVSNTNLNDYIAKQSEEQNEKAKQYVNDIVINGMLTAPSNVFTKAAEAISELFSKNDNETEPSKPIGDKWIDLLKMSQEPLTKDEDQALVNPNYDRYDDKYSMNCSYCTAAYDIRRRGYDVEAMPYDPNVENPSIYGIMSWYKNSSSTELFEVSPTLINRPGEYSELSRRTSEEMFDEAENVMTDYHPEGSYGQFCVGWTYGGGHSMVWENDNGSVIIRDCQTNQTYTYSDWVEENGYWVDKIYVFRTDNLELSSEVLRVVRNREDN